MSVSPTTQVLTVEQAAEYLQLTPEELTGELESGKVPGWKVAGKWRIKKDILDQLLLGETTKAVNQSGIVHNGLSTTIQINSSSTDDTYQETFEPEKEPDPISLNDPLIENNLEDIIPEGFTRGKVFVYNFHQGYGYARLVDNRVVWLDANKLANKTKIPFPGDVVEFRLHHSRKGWEGLDIRVVPKIIERDSTGCQKEIPPRNNIATHQANQSPIPTTKLAVSGPFPPGGTPASQELYQKAALARAEGRFDEARQLFKHSIEAGAGTQIYSAYFRMEVERGNQNEARRVMQDAIEHFPYNTTFYEMLGQMERRSRNYTKAEEIFRLGLKQSPKHVSLRWGLGQTLVQIGTENSLKEAGAIFEQLDKEGKLNKSDRLYHRFKALQQSPRANRAYDFFSDGGMRVGIAGRRDLPSHITDIVFETDNQEFKEAFGLSGAFLVRCFQGQPNQVDINNTGKFLRSLGPHGQLGLQDREVVLNTSVAFIAVPDINRVRDQIMSILSDNNEAIIPLDDSIFRNNREPLETLREQLGTYLGMRDLYNSTLPVSGRRHFGREKLLNKLTDELHSGQFIGIYGLRKMGKTSLIYQLRDVKLKDEAVSYVDLQSSPALTVKNCDPIYWELERDLYLRLVEKYPFIKDILRLGKEEFFSSLPDHGTHAPLVFGEDLRKLLDVIANGRMGNLRRIVIVLDELEKILPIGDQPGLKGYLEFFGFLRGIAQTERYRNLLCSVVVAANATISERGFWDGRENPVFALYKPEPLPPLSEKECQDMIRTLGRGMSVYWDDDAISAVFTETGGHPFLTRIFCSKIARNNPGRPLAVRLKMVEDEIPKFIRDEGDKLEQITELLRVNFPDEGRFLEQIALDELKKELSDEALRHLLNYELIEPKDGQYVVNINLLKRWLRRRAGVRE